MCRKRTVLSHQKRRVANTTTERSALHGKCGAAEYETTATAAHFAFCVSWRRRRRRQPFPSISNGRNLPGPGLCAAVLCALSSLAPYSPYLALVALINATRLHTQLLLFRTLCMAKRVRGSRGGNPLLLPRRPSVLFQIGSKTSRTTTTTHYYYYEW